MNGTLTLKNPVMINGDKITEMKYDSNLAGTGKVSLGGNMWTARTENEGGTIPVDAVVTVLRVEGVKLIVKIKGKEGGNET